MSDGWGQVVADAAEQAAVDRHREAERAQNRAAEQLRRDQYQDRAQEARYWTGEESRTRANLRRDEERRAARERDRGVER